MFKRTPIAILLTLTFSSAVFAKDGIATTPENPTISIDESVSYTGELDNGINIVSADSKIPYSATFNGESIIVDFTTKTVARARGIYSGGYSVVNVGSSKTKNIYVNIKNTFDGIEPDSAYINTTGLMVNQLGAKMNVTTEDLTVIVHSDNYEASGIKVQGNSNPETSMVINAKNIYVSVTKGLDGKGTANGIEALSSAQMFINGNLEVHATNAITARGGNTKLRINESESSTVKLYGDISFEYDAKSSGTVIDADLDIRLTTEDSIWVGNTKVAGNPPAGKDSVTQGRLTLSHGGQWVATTVTPNSSNESVRYQALNFLTLNDGIITLQQASDQNVVIESLKGTGGTINVKTTKSDTGFTTSKIEIKSIENPESNPPITIKQVYQGVTADDVSTTDFDSLNSVNLGQDVKVTQTQVVTEGEIVGELTRTVNADGVPGTVSEGANTKQDAYMSLTTTSILAWRHDMNDLTKRMGELRDAPEGIGAWARIYGSEQESGAQNLLTKSTSIQVGGDVDAGNGWKVGAAFSYTDSETSYASGSADSDAYAAAVYGSWLAENGQFVDLIAKYTRMNSDFNLGGFEGSSDNDALSVSAEYGWHFKLNDVAFVEPQVELTYGRISGDKFKSSSDTTIDQDDYDSLIGRVGVRAGFYFPEHRGTIYARVSGVYDFLGEYEYTASNTSVTKKFKDDLGGSWVEYAVGANFNWTENTYTYVDLERTSGGEVRENYRWNIGLRHVF